MARVKVHTVCGQPLSDCLCGPDDDDETRAPAGDQDSGDDAA